MSDKKPAVLTDKDIAAILEGDLGTRAGEVTIPAGAGETAEAKLAREVEEKRVADAAAAKLAADTAAAKLAADTAAAAAGATESEVVKLLKAQVKEKDEALVAGALTKVKLEEKLAVVETTQAALLDIARASVGRMRVAMGGAVGEASTLGAVEALSEHSRLSAEFQKKFKVGGVASVAVEQDKGSEKSASDPLRAAKVAASRA
jgi:hypothetical protein